MSSPRPVHLLSLAQPAVALGDQLTLGDPGHHDNAGEIWNVITRSASLVKDGQRLENLAWRHWAQPRQYTPYRRTSTSTASSTSLPLTPTGCSACKRSFGGALQLLLEEDSNFKDWVTEAKKQLPLPDTPIAKLEIRLVEPTPAPSRVGSLGASLALAPPVSSTLTDVIEDESTKSPRKRGKFFVQSSPKSGSGSESSHPSPKTHLPRRISRDLPTRQVSLSTMKGKFQAEKRRMAKALTHEDSGWEDEEDEAPPAITQATPPAPAPTPLYKMSKKERQAAMAERAKIEADLEAQRKREMFAKQQIFGKTTPGLLTGIFKSGGSMVDLTQAGQAPVQTRWGPNLLRSKSAIAVPIGTSVNVQRFGESDDSNRGPKDVEMETDDSEDEDHTLASSVTERKLAERAAKERARTSAGSDAVAISPTTRRRTIIMREMSESLRRNLILEREKSAAFPKLPVHDEQPPPPRRAQTVLGAGFLRPLTRVGQPAQEALIRAQSSADLTNEVQPTAVAMARSSTDGETKRKEIEKRRPDYGYRTHGW